MKSKILILIRIIIFFIPETSCFGLKRWLYRLAGVSIGKNVQICSSAKIYPFGKVSFGDHVWIGQEAFISCNEGSTLIIEDYAKLGARSILITGFHEITPNGNCIAGEGNTSRIVIKKGATICTSTMVLPGQTINEMSLVAAGAVVTKDVPAYHLVAGVPAKVIKDLRNEP